MKSAKIDRLELVFRNDFNLLCYICNQYPIPQYDHLDLIQEALTKTISKIESVKNDNYGGIRSFLIKVLKNLCLDYLRKDRRLNAVITNDKAAYEDSQTQIADKSPDPLQKIILIEDSRMHLWIMGKLNARYKPVIELVFEGHKPGRIAEILKKNPSTIREYKMKGLKEYKKILNKIAFTKS